MHPPFSMSQYAAFLLRSLAVALLLVQASAADVSWDERLARTFSDRLEQMDKELARIAPELDGLPRIPIDDQGGTGGFASIHTQALPAWGTRWAVDVHWPASALIDLVALVPARRYGVRGLDAEYGLPDAFTVELLDANGDVVGRVAQERNTRGHPVRSGHPFVYQVSPPLAATGLRISADLLIADAEGEGNFVHAWAEALAFEGERNVAAGA
ncbi:MAG: hypothetical protein WCJ66_12515, partial [Verrucomicrobiota bacterium]